MQKVGVYEARSRLSELLEKVKTGQEIVITNHGEPVARLVPIRSRDREEMRTLVEETRRLKRTYRIGRVSLRKIVEEGRR